MAPPSDPLAEYKRRRDFSRTGEPAGSRRRRGKSDSLRFLVQKHDATRLHYDFRLEWDGVLKSWAVTRGPSTDPEDKRLAVRTEDHPLDYGDFEGTIPEKQYGGGTVMLWDTGTWEPLHDPEEGLKAGKLHFHLHGDRMKGGWALVRMHPRKGEKRENWLLIKERDDEATGDGEALTRTNTTSVVSGRSMQAIAADRKSAEWTSAARPPDKSQPAPRKQAPREPASGKPASGKPARRKAAAPPAFEKPQLATLVDAPPEGDDWLHEVKFDGYRLVVAVGGGAARCYTRSGLDWTDKFTGIATALSGLACGDALIDGEVVAGAADDGGSSFSALQKALKTGSPLRFYAFDLLARDGTDLRQEPQIERKAALKDLLATLPDDAPVRYSEHVRGNGAAVLREICKAGEEGIVSKRAAAPYRGRRTRDWLKVKCTRRQEFVIGGYSPSDKKGRPFASILLGTHDGTAFVYRGRVGTGFDEASMEDLARRFARLERKTMPFDAVPRDRARDARWLTPKLVAEVDFAELTDDGHIRHGAFLGLREDKEAKAVTLEGKAARKAGTPARQAGTKHRQDQTSAARAGEDAGSDPRSGSDLATALIDAAGEGDGDAVLGIRISHPDRIVFAEQGVSKIDLARYYALVAPRMLTHLANHPLSLVRCPQGPKRACFFQKHASDGFPPQIREVPITEKSGETANYLYIDAAEGLVAAVQMGTLEFHVWGSAIDRLDRPDRIVFDLDPDEGLGFSAVRDAAADMRARLADLGLESVPMVTGGKGVHVIVPLERRADWPRVKAFARAFATGMAADEPDRFVATMSKEKRKGRIFIDWLRNERGATAIAPYSTRSRKGAPIATPVSWDELAGLGAANGFHIADILDRLGADPWANASRWRQSVTAAMLKAVDG